MRFSFALIFSFLLASTVLARRHGGKQRSKSSSRLGKTEGADIQSLNWGGAVLSGQNITAIRGTFRIHPASGPPGAVASVAIGIDGATCGSTFLQAGVEFNVGYSDAPTYLAWYQFGQGSAVYSNMYIFAEDSVSVAIYVHTPTTALVVIENLSKAANETHELQSPSQLCQQDAAWIVTDFQENGKLLPFANFGSVTFSDTGVASPSANYVPSNATIWDIVQNGQNLTSTSINGTSITINYV